MFIDDKEKMRDFIALDKEDFLKSYSYLTEKDYDETKMEVCFRELKKNLWFDKDKMTHTFINSNGCLVLIEDENSFLEFNVAISINYNNRGLIINITSNQQDDIIKRMLKDVQVVNIIETSAIDYLINSGVLMKSYDDDVYSWVEDKLANDIICPICNEKLKYVKYQYTCGKFIHIYKHENSCPFIAFEYVEKNDLLGFIDYMKRREN